MKRFALVIAGVVGLVGCGDGGGWKETCSATKPCPSGNYCATTTDGSVCWPDSTPPQVGTVTAACGVSSTCRRDGTLHVTAVVTDDQKVGTVEATLDLDPAHPHALTNTTGDTYAADIALVDVPFDYYQHDVTVTVNARDGAQNLATPPGTAQVTVTREAWARKQLATTGSLRLWSPAVMTDGHVVVAGENGQVHILDKSGADAPVSVTTNLLNGPPSVGPTAIWVGSEDGRLYAVGLTGSTVKPCPVATADPIAPMTGAPVIVGTRAVSATKSSQAVVADAAGTCAPTSVTTTGQTANQPVAGSNGHVFIPAGGTLQSYTILGSGALQADWTTPATVGNVSAPPAIDAGGSIWTVSIAGAVYQTSSAGTAQTVTFTPALAADSGGAVALSDGSVVVPGGSGMVLRRTGTSTWTSASLIGRPTIPMALTGSTPSLLVATDSGYVYAISQVDGSALWWKQLTSTTRSLDSPNIWTDPGAKTSTAYLAGADGYLYGVIVDGALDTSAPWPKAYHDPQNTSHAGATP